MAGTDRQRDVMTGGPVIVLVEPQLGENIGMVARAMANFGLSNLRIVNPRDGWPNEKAVSAASRADHVIAGAAVYPTLNDAVADLTFIYATTARSRDGFKPVRGPEEAGKVLRAREGRGEKTGILFGRERTGLKNEEVAMADEIVTFPVNPAYASLNIAQAVLLMSYEWMKSGLEDVNETPFSGPDMLPARRGQLDGFMAHLEDVLDARGYFRSPAKKPKMLDNLRAVFTRPGFFAAELDVLRGVISSLEKFTPANPTGKASPSVRRRQEAVPPDGQDEGREP